MHHAYYRPELDALRFFAFVCVFCSHVLAPPAWYRPIFDMGSMGLSIFFLLSAFLITTLLLNEKEQYGTVHVRQFFLRRALRIWPLYLCAIVGAVLLGALVPEQQVDGMGILSLLLLAGNVFVAKQGWILGVLNPLWSISVEEQFYVFVPWLARLLKRRALLAVYLGILFAAYGVLIVLGSRHEVYRVGIWANSFVQFQFFAAGGLLALWRQGRSTPISRNTRGALLMTGTACWFAAANRFHIHDLTTSNLPDSLGAYVAALIGSVAIFLAVLETGVRLPPPLIYLGKISYGLYVFHQFFINLCFDPRFLLGGAVPGIFVRHRASAAAAAMCATILCAMLSYRYLETPFLRLKHRFEFLTTRPV